MILLGHDKVVSDWVGRINGKPFIEVCKAIGVINSEGRLTGGYVFTGYNGDSIEVSIAGRGSMTREGWSSVLAYVFGQLKCSRMQMHTNVENKKMCKILGEELPRRCFEGIARKFYGKHDAACYALTTDDLSALRAKWRL